MKKLVVAMTLPLALSACMNTSVPAFDTLGVGQLETRDRDKNIQIKPSDIIHKVQCDLYAGMNKTDDPASGPSMKEMLRDYAVGVSLNLRVDDNGGASPSVSFIDPYATLSQSFGFGFSGQLNQTRERTYSEDFLVVLNNINADNCAADSIKQGAPTLNGINLLGDLGLMDVAQWGLRSVPAGEKAILPANFGNGAPGYTPVPGADDGKRDPHPSFGSSMQFTITRAIGLGPTWTFAQFKGPSGSPANGAGGAASASSLPGTSNASLVNFGRTDTHQLWVAFAHMTPARPVLSPELDARLFQQTTHARELAEAKDRLANLKLEQANVDKQRHALLAQRRRAANRRLTELKREIASQQQDITKITQNLDSDAQEVQRLKSVKEQATSKAAADAANDTERDIAGIMQQQGLHALTAIGPR